LRQEFPGELVQVFGQPPQGDFSGQGGDVKRENRNGKGSEDFVGSPGGVACEGDNKS